ncbi:type II secretion system protein, partial [bacterium]|nr:type II secretion system protein [bacterium]
DTLCIGALLHRRQIFDWKHHALVLISYVKNLRNRRSLLVPLRGFTLAEVLITLGIIGVVAALTIPTLMQKIDDRETVSKVKKFHSAFSQAYALAVAEHGTVDKWGLVNSEVVTDENGKSVHTSVSSQNSDKFFQIILPYFNKISYSDKSSENSSNDDYMILSDGTFIQSVWLQPEKCAANPLIYNCGDIYFRTDKKRYDDKRNLYNFTMYRDKIVPTGFSKSQNDMCLNNTDLTKCTAWVLTYENRDYLKCNDLDWNTKTKCK